MPPAEAATRRARTGGEHLGVGAILGQHPHHRPASEEISRAPVSRHQPSRAPV